MKKSLFPLLLIVMVFAFASCTIQSHGDTLYGFTQRMNELSDTYELNEAGYIFDQKSHTLSRFYKFNEKEILLQFKMNTENILTEMNVVFMENYVEGTDEFNFIKNSISAFIDDEETEKALFSEKALSELLKVTDNHTVKINEGDTQLLLDVTDSGTVITVVKNSP